MASKDNSIVLLLTALGITGIMLAVGRSRQANAAPDDLDSDDEFEDDDDPSPDDAPGLGETPDQPGGSPPAWSPKPGSTTINLHFSAEAYLPYVPDASFEVSATPAKTYWYRVPEGVSLQDLAAQVYGASTIEERNQWAREINAWNPWAWRKPFSSEAGTWPDGVIDLRPRWAIPQPGKRADVVLPGSSRPTIWLPPTINDVDNGYVPPPVPPALPAAMLR